MRLFDILFGRVDVQRLAQKADYHRLAVLIADFRVADEAAAPLVAAGTVAFPAVLDAARRARSELTEAVISNDEDLHHRIDVLCAYITVLGRFGFPDALPMIVEAFACAATGATPPSEVLSSLDRLDLEELERLRDPSYQPRINEVLHRSRFHKRVFLNTRAYSKLLHAASNVLLSQRSHSTPLLIKLLEDHRPPVRYRCREILRKIGGQDVNIVLQKSPEDDKALGQWSILYGIT